MAEDTKLQDMIRTSLESIRAMVDANTVVGTPIQTAPGTTIIPISKISVGYASGGLDFGSKTGASKNFGGGGGTGLTVQPVCFLTVNAEGEVDLIPLTGNTPDTIDRIADVVEQAPEIIAKLRALLGKKKKKKSKEESDRDLDDMAAAAAAAAGNQDAE